ncbi:hypothetical protein CTAYLR_002892 [Chrysophaeum taylorii]|uniref:Uncharacterized protein n=1 Tax=Chrysophaeum taylorii TaxID=2483200 RepID=A0AAD7UPA0_9STRA|nr:hypothetical protein CTAYLR_002892 [Chrysophaeum taylorii]
MARRLKIVVMPLWRRHWALHAKVVEPVSTKPSGGLGRVQNVIWERSAAQYQALKKAKPGTFRDLLRRVAERVVDQASPEESLLGALAPRSSSIQVVFPASLSAKLVRRRLRLVSRHGQRHRCWSLIWGVATPLLFPLVLSPVSNIPIFYAAWRCYAHHKAATGANVLRDVPLELAPSPELDDLARRAWSDAPVDPSSTDALEGLDGLANSLDRKLRWLRLRGDLPSLSDNRAASSSS